MAAARGLRHNASPEAFADAMVACRNGDPGACSYHGHCMQGGECFRRPRKRVDATAALDERISRLEAIVAKLTG